MRNSVEQWLGERVHGLRREYVGLEEIADGIWTSTSDRCGSAAFTSDACALRTSTAGSIVNDICNPCPQTLCYRCPRLLIAP